MTDFQNPLYCFYNTNFFKTRQKFSKNEKISVGNYTAPSVPLLLKEGEAAGNVTIMLHGYKAAL